MQSSLAPFAPSEGYIVPCGDPTQLAPVRDLPLYAYRGHTTPLARFHRLRTIVDFVTRQGATALKLGFTPSLGRLSNCQATEDDWRGRRPAVPRVSPLKRTVASIPPSTSSPQTTSVNDSTTNDSPPSLRFLTYMRVAVTTATTMNAPTMTTPPNAPKRCKYGPHSRPRDEMETKENVVGSTFNAR